MRQWILNNDGTMTSRLTEDVEPNLDMAKVKRDSAPMKGARYNQEFTHVAHIPPVIVEKMMNEDGVNFFDKNDHQKVFDLMQTKYRAFMTMPGKPFPSKGHKIYVR